MATIALIGTGGMGSRMAGRLLDRGHDLRVWNRTPERAAPLAERGARPAKTPADACRGAQFVITMLADPDALLSVAAGDDGIAGGLDSDAIALEMSTVGPAAIHQYAGMLPPGAQLLDAPVLGSVGEAESGTLRIFVGGQTDLADRAWPVLEDLGTPTRIGELGTGAAAKLVANLTLVGTLGLVGEALALGRSLGLDLDTTFDVLSLTPLAAQANRRRTTVEQGTYPPRFELRLAVKDADLIEAAGRDAGVDLRVVRSARSWFADAVTDGRGELDYTAVIAEVLDSNPTGGPAE
jgi:3-hydroxyisobutyrate dehydrogenase-like beta-hydroxyacid dehydrogenase